MPENTNQANNRAVDSAVQPCPAQHYFSYQLKPADAPANRPAWWPAERRHPYAGVRLNVTLGGVPPKQTLNSSGRFRIDGIPGGSASLDFDDFYADIKTTLAEGRSFSP